MVLPGKGLISDQTIEFTDALTAKKCPILLRRIGYRDPETDKHYIFLTNNSLLLPVTVASFTVRPSPTVNPVVYGSRQVRRYPAP